MIIRNIKTGTVAVSSLGFVVELEVWNPDESDTVYFITMAHNEITDHFYIADESVFEKVMALWSSLYNTTKFNALRDEIEHRITQKFEIIIGTFDIDSDDTPFPEEMELCIGLYEKHKENTDFTSYIGMEVETVRKQLVPGEYEKSMRNSELMSTIRETTEKLVSKLQKAAWHDYKDLSIKVNSMSGIEVIDESNTVILSKEETEWV